MAASTYGVATLLSAAYHNKDHNTFDTIARSVDLGVIVASAFQLVHLLLVSIPGGRLSSHLGSPKDRTFDIRAEAIEYFDDYISTHTVDASAFSNIDPMYMVTAISTVVMGSVLPVLEERDPDAISIEQEGLDERGFLVVIAAISEAAVQSFREYIGLTDLLPELGVNPDYATASNKLLSLVPGISYLLEANGSNNI